MRKLYISQPRNLFWEKYWKKAVEDADSIQDTNQYPLHLVSKYIDNNSRIVELGCGLGRVLKHYHHQGIHIEGLEYDKYCVDKLQQENSAYRVIEGNIISLPYADKSFTIAMAFGVLGHLEKDMDKAFSEVNRILEPDGILAGSLCCHNLGRFIFGLIAKIKILLKRSEKHFYTHLFSKKEIKNMLSDHGFELKELAPILSPEVLYNYFPFLRGRKVDFSQKQKRSSHAYYPLNFVGKGVYFIIKKLMPYQYTFAYSFIAVKMKDKT
jgi:SAM-dependent methyltransferase